MNFYHELSFRKAMRLALSVSEANPANDILFPGIYFPGLLRYINKCFSDHLKPAPLRALLALKLVLPVCLPRTPPSLGPAELLSSPWNKINSYSKGVASCTVIIEDTFADSWVSFRDSDVGFLHLFLLFSSHFDYFID